MSEINHSSSHFLYWLVDREITETNSETFPSNSCRTLTTLDIKALEPCVTFMAQLLQKVNLENIYN